MQIIDIFSGIGGFSLSGSWLGWRTIQFCENNEFCNQILKKHWPGIPIHPDIKTLTSEQIINNELYDPKEKTILTGGVPCQPWSNAGKRQGESDIRNLWPETIELIGSFLPDFAVLENVPGLLTWNKGLFFENICTSLEDKGYEIWPFIIPSASIGAWDKRDRVWIIAHNNNSRNRTSGNGINKNREKESEKQQQSQSEFSRQIEITSDNANTGVKEVRSKRENSILFNPDTKSTIYKQSRTTRSRRNGCSNSNSNIICEGLQRHSGNDLSSREKEQERSTGQANWSRSWIEVASELCRSNARVPHRMERIKALGNSVNPHVVYEIFKAIEQLN